MVGVVLVASPLVGAAAAGVGLRWQEMQESRSAATTTTTAPASADEPQSQTAPREERSVASRDAVAVPATTEGASRREEEIAALGAEVAARLADASPAAQDELDVEALQAATRAGDRNRAMSLLAEAEAAALSASREAARREAARREAEEAALLAAIDAAEASMEALLDADLALTAAGLDVLAMAGSALYDAIDAEDWPKVMSLLAEAETRTAALRVHPNVHDEAVAQLEAVVARYEPDWPWVRAAWDAAEVRFYDPRLPGVSAPAAAITSASDTRSQLWFTLDVLRPSEGPYAEPRRLENTLLHELGHVWNNGLGGGDWPLVQAQFYEHYAGCRGRGLSSEGLREELLADAMVMTTRDIAQRGPGSINGRFILFAGYYDPDGNSYGNAFGYYNADGFTGCLVDGAGPPQHLTDTIREALHNNQTDATDN